MLPPNWMMRLQCRGFQMLENEICASKGMLVALEAIRRERIVNSLAELTALSFGHKLCMSKLSLPANKFVQMRL